MRAVDIRCYHGGPSFCVSVSDLSFKCSFFFLLHSSFSALLLRFAGILGSHILITCSMNSVHSVVLFSNRLIVAASPVVGVAFLTGSASNRGAEWVQRLSAATATE